MAVGGLQGVRDVDVNLVLARRRLTLRELDRDARRGEQVAKLAVDRLGPGGLNQLIVLVGPAEGRQPLEPFGMGFLVALP